MKPEHTPWAIAQQAIANTNYTAVIVVTVLPDGRIAAGGHTNMMQEPAIARMVDGALLGAAQVLDPTAALCVEASKN